MFSQGVSEVSPLWLVRICVSHGCVMPASLCFSPLPSNSSLSGHGEGGAFSVMHLLLPFDRRIKGTPCNVGSSVSAQLPSLQQLTLQYQQLPQPRALVSVSPTQSDHCVLPGLHVLVPQPRNCTKAETCMFPLLRNDSPLLPAV